MKEYLLFIDIESSGLPKQWDVPYSQEGNWPYTVQVAWVVYSKDQQEVKRENHFIRPLDFEISAESLEIHSLTHEFLHDNGKTRKEVLLLLQEDLQRYQPLVVGHFMEFDYHVLNADYYRAGLPSPFDGLDTFCTMLASSELMRLPRKRYLRLGELYGYLFHKTLEDQHDAVVDADATAACFFELRKRQIITEATIAQQRLHTYSTQPAAPARSTFKLPGWLLGALGLLLLVLLLFYWL
ncbi:3'-5' exonuclease [Rufibacter radiotolerans]|uniref:3'-5' exonuclease n=1 Tax=Rufibacter radiotolerans TaxID=1379910 RepID=UPI00069D1AEB|nr:3'-5' exonuclease [Rufibacter radiotolerans]